MNRWAIINCPCGTIAPFVIETHRMSELRRTDSNVSEGEFVNGSESYISGRRSEAEESLEPTADELAVLSGFERFAFRLTHRMNLGRWKRFWTWCQSVFGAGWIQISTYNLMRLYGLENIEAVDHTRPVLLVANHRSFFDMYTV